MAKKPYHPFNEQGGELSKVTGGKNDLAGLAERVKERLEQRLNYKPLGPCVKCGATGPDGVFLQYENESLCSHCYRAAL